MICIVETSFNSELDENIMASKHKRTFRKPKNAEEEKQLLENAVPKSTRSVNKWAMKIFSEWQSTRVNKKASEEPSSWIDGNLPHYYSLYKNVTLISILYIKNTNEGNILYKE